MLRSSACCKTPAIITSEICTTENPLAHQVADAGSSVGQRSVYSCIKYRFEPVCRLMTLITSYRILSKVCSVY